MIDKMDAYEEKRRRQSMDMLACENSHMAELLEEIRNLVSDFIEQEHNPLESDFDFQSWLAKAKKVDL